MYLNEYDRQKLTKLIGKKFPSFGGGQTSNTNPIVNATTDKPYMFVAGVDIREVVDVIVDSIDERNLTLVEELKWQNQNHLR